MSKGFQFKFTPQSGVEVRIDPQKPKEPFVLTSPVTLEITGEAHAAITVPKDFAYDMASIPRLLWFIIPRDDRRIARAATIHDYLYATQSLPRAMADAIFMETMKQDGMPYIKRKACYLAVRLFGSHAYDTDD
jgi:hypothetical protein